MSFRCYRDWRYHQRATSRRAVPTAANATPNRVAVEGRDETRALVAGPVADSETRSARAPRPGRPRAQNALPGDGAVPAAIAVTCRAPGNEVAEGEASGQTW